MSCTLRRADLRIRLSKAEEKRLCRRMRQGDQVARELLVHSQIPWVMQIAHRLARPQDDLDDLISVGLVALLISVDQFDARLARLSTFVHKPVVWRILAYQRKTSTLCRPTNCAQQWAQQWHAAANVAAELREHEHPAIGPTDTTEVEEEIDRLRAAINRLPKRLRLVVRSRLAGQTLEHIGDRLQISKERVRQLERKAHEWLRTSPELSYAR
jgi:RNA polymerase primary sigma factor